MNTDKDPANMPTAPAAAAVAPPASHSAPAHATGPASAAPGHAPTPAPHGAASPAKVTPQAAGADGKKQSDDAKKEPSPRKETSPRGGARGASPPRDRGRSPPRDGQARAASPPRASSPSRKAAPPSLSKKPVHHRGQTIPHDIRASVNMTDPRNLERGEDYFKTLLSGLDRCQTPSCSSAPYLVQSNGYCTNCNRKEKMRGDEPLEASATAMTPVEADAQKKLALKASDNDAFRAHEGKQHDEYIRMVASRLHQLWRDLRRRKNGTYEPRVKTIHVTVDGKTVEQKYDIANLDYDHLPEVFQQDNRDAADVACEQVKNEVGTLTDVRKSTGLLGAEFLERAAAMQHEEWMKRVKKHPDVEVDPNLMVNYHRLPEPEREKCRVIVREAIRLYRLWCLRAPAEQRWMKFNEDDQIQSLTE